MKRIFCLMALAATLTMASQAMGYTLSFSPATQDISLGDSATINVNLALEGPEVLQGFNFALGFDSNILQFASLSSPEIPIVGASVTPGDFSLFYGNYIGGFTYQSNINPDTIGFNGFLPTTPLDPSDGNFTLAALTFTGINWGTSPLTLTGDLDLGQDDAGNFLYYLIDESATVNVVPEPATCLLMGLGLAGIICFRRKTAAR